MTGPAPQLVDIDPDWLAAGQLPTEKFGSSFIDPELEPKFEAEEFDAGVVDLKSLPLNTENFLVDELLSEPEFDGVVAVPPAGVDEEGEGVIASIAAAAAEAVAEVPGGVAEGMMAMGFERTLFREGDPGKMGVGVYIGAVVGVVGCGEVDGVEPAGAEVNNP